MSNRTPKKAKKDLFFEKYDLYSDANPNDTIRVKYDTVDNLKKTIRKFSYSKKLIKVDYGNLLTNSSWKVMSTLFPKIERGQIEIV